MAATVRSVIEEESFVLLETLAAAVAQAVFEANEHVMEVVATVHKPGAAKTIGVDDVSVVSVFPPGSADEP
jgi:dihydroneopterin aldolase